MSSKNYSIFFLGGALKNTMDHRGEVNMGKKNDCIIKCFSWNSCSNQKLILMRLFTSPKNCGVDPIGNFQKALSALHLVSEYPHRC